MSLKTFLSTHYQSIEAKTFGHTSWNRPPQRSIRTFYVWCVNAPTVLAGRATDWVFRQSTGSARPALISSRPTLCLWVARIALWRLESYTQVQTPRACDCRNRLSRFLNVISAPYLWASVHIHWLLSLKASGWIEIIRGEDSTDGVHPGKTQAPEEIHGMVKHQEESSLTSNDIFHNNYMTPVNLFRKPAKRHFGYSSPFLPEQSVIG